MKKIIVFLIVLFAPTCFAQQVDVSLSPIFMTTKLINTEETIMKKNLALETSFNLIDKDISIGYKNWVWNEEIKYQYGEFAYIYKSFRPFISLDSYKDKEKVRCGGGIKFIQGYQNKYFMDLGARGIDGGYGLNCLFGLNSGGKFVGIGGIYNKIDNLIINGWKFSFGFMF